MTNTPRQKWLTVIIAESLIVILFIAAATQSANKHYRLHKTLDTKKLQELLIKGKSNRLLLDIYPVKQSTAVNKQDFDVLVVPRDKDGKPFTQSNKGEFEKGSANYARFLHQNNLAADAALLGYRATIEEKQLKKGTKVEIFLDAMQPILNKLYISGPPGGKYLYNDSAPVGECPPCLLDPEMAQVLAKEYKSKPHKK
ncbi:hypothetical protein A4D02_14350 [Niastella koreensis]|uniref:Uncharacterized protein n=2 Tax=Niastella koreensis TaxID=354356 RepID=G8T9C5_NIAKG|nr:hypothetical protein [Niastella koreensis]AEV98093.1 hypothetical protein Niako_1730 [Niastella koreensis GR20-10]OQP40110.1 hypothetical protein A4D02_14350 [Niastella koreensis]